MSHKEKMSELRQILERWNSHNEVHARPADKMLYEFLSKLLNQAEDDEQETPVDAPPVQNAANDDPPGEGGNSPEGTPDLP